MGEPLSSPAPQAFVVEPRRPGVAERLRELRQSRALFSFFARRALEKIYARTVLGWGWLLARPLIDVGTRALIFGGLLGAPSGGIPYFLFFLAGMTIWSLFERTTWWATRGIELNRGLLRKIYVPRLVLPLASASPAIVEFAVYLGMLVLALGFFVLHDGHLYLSTGPQLLAAVAAVALALGLALGISLWTSVLAARARDVRFTLQYALGFWFFLTPVIYPLSAVPDKFKTLAAVNPMSAIVELFRYGLLGAGGEVTALGLAISIGSVVVIGAGGLVFFARHEAAAVESM
jgi:lipopolysaccharide transport system permease protein